MPSTLIPSRFAECLDFWNSKLVDHAQRTNQCTFRFKLQDPASDSFFKLDLVRVDMHQVIATTTVLHDHVKMKASSKLVDLDTHDSELYNLGLQSMTLAMTLVLLGLVPHVTDAVLYCENVVSVYICLVYSPSIVGVFNLDMEPVKEPGIKSETKSQGETPSDKLLRLARQFEQKRDQDPAPRMTINIDMHNVRSAKLAEKVLDERLAGKTKLADVCHKTRSSKQFVDLHKQVARLSGTVHQHAILEYICMTFTSRLEYRSFYGALFAIMHLLKHLNSDHFKFLHDKFAKGTHALSKIFAKVTHKLSLLMVVDLQAVEAVMASLHDEILHTMQHFYERPQHIKEWLAFYTRHVEAQSTAQET